MRLQFALVVLLLLGCATPQKIAETPSGRPEVVVRAGSEEVVSVIVGLMAGAGWMIEDQSTNQVTFSKEMTGMQAALMQVAIGNSYSTTPRTEVRYILTGSAVETRVIVQVSASTQMAFGQVRRTDMSTNVSMFNDLQRQLEAIRAKIEGRDKQEPQ